MMKMMMRARKMIHLLTLKRQLDCLSLNHKLSLLIIEIQKSLHTFS
jgi:hypothetical protein